ncbi:MAG TPA: DoxX family protein [Candidatus Dormibacteraeota bacterium]|nr:DoxX family protein [Candidatus Dormibacteraeota bacterium]
MNIALWILQVLLGVFFIWHMTTLLRVSAEHTPAQMRWALDLPRGLRLFAAVAEGAAGLALIFAPLVHPIAWLAPLAAAGLVLLMAGAIVFHLPRREYPNIGLNAVLGVLAAVIAVARFGPYHF